jgi:hypothetical protein
MPGLTLIRLAEQLVAVQAERDAIIRSKFKTARDEPCTLMFNPTADRHLLRAAFATNRCRHRPSLLPAVAECAA